MGFVFIGGTSCTVGNLQSSSNILLRQRNRYYTQCMIHIWFVNNCFGCEEKSKKQEHRSKPPSVQLLTVQNTVRQRKEKGENFSEPETILLLDHIRWKVTHNKNIIHKIKQEVTNQIPKTMTHTVSAVLI